MKQLIVNADDFGADTARNEGIAAGIEAGSVTSCSILPNGPALEDALARIRSLDFRVSFGVHLNLSEGRPVSSALELLTGADGNFLGKYSAHRLLTESGSRKLEEEIIREIDAQIGLVQNALPNIDHIDGHQHVHVFPAVLRWAAEAAKRRGIQWIRIPEEECHNGSYAEEALLFSIRARAARPIFAEFGFRATDHFSGLCTKGRLPASQWPEFMASIPDGITELMVHPGRVPREATGPFSKFSTIDRQQELDALIDGRFRAAAAEAGVLLTAFPYPERDART